MLDAARQLIDILTNLARAAMILVSIFAVIKVCAKTSFALVPVAGVALVVFFANWALGNINWATNLFNKDAQQLGAPVVHEITQDTLPPAELIVDGRHIVRLTPGPSTQLPNRGAA